MNDGARKGAPSREEIAADGIGPAGPVGCAAGDPVAALTPIPLPLRDRMREGPYDAPTHRANFSRLPALGEIELSSAAAQGEQAVGTLRIAAWNVERLRHVEAVTRILARHRPDVALLSEVDKGMARSGNRHGLAALAGALGHGYAYGVEFVELGLGDPDEIAESSAQSNESGFHGNAVTASLRLRRPFMIRLEADGGWFGPARGQQRVGGRMAIGAQVGLAGRSVTIVSVHLESNSSPAQRRDQTARLLDALERYDEGAPLVIGGDFNSSTIDRTGERDDELRRRELVADPLRLVEVEPYEPLFREMAERGLDWRAANVPGQPTERRRPGSAARPLAKIDWIFTRALVASAPAIVAAEDDGGAPISDHDCLLVTVAPTW
jgi:endonuclease/exonuclease/phosphatase family metal-dependent hydrolase